jgi:hypothetical protein
MMAVTTRHLRSVPNPDHARQEARGGEVLAKLRALRTQQRKDTERDLLRSLARGFRLSPEDPISPDQLAEKFDSMADEIDTGVRG